MIIDLSAGTYGAIIGLLVGLIEWWIMRMVLLRAQGTDGEARVRGSMVSKILLIGNVIIFPIIGYVIGGTFFE